MKYIALKKIRFIKNRLLLINEKNGVTLHTEE